MRFLIDRCAGQLLADWIRRQGHDVVDSRELGPDLGTWRSCTKIKIEISTTRTGNPYDNAKAERFMRTLKYEEVYMNDYETKFPRISVCKW